MSQKLSLTKYQLTNLINQLSGHNELYWLNLMFKFPLSVEQCHNLPFYKQLSKFIHILKPNLPSQLQRWIALYFTTLFEDGFDDGTTGAWTTLGGSPTVETTQTHHGTYALKEAGGNDYARKTLSAQSDCAFRFYFWFGAQPTSGTNWNGGRFAVTSRGYAFYGWHTDQYKLVTKLWNPSTDTYHNLGAGLATSTWHWIEMNYHEGAADGFYKIIVDDVTYTDLTGLDTSGYTCSNFDCGVASRVNWTSNMYFDCAKVTDDPVTGIGAEVDISPTGGNIAVLMSQMGLL